MNDPIIVAKPTGLIVASVIWNLYGENPSNSAECLGFIPGWLDPAEEDCVRDQLDKHYQHGGGWQPMEGWTLGKVEDGLFLTYSKEEGDPPYYPLAIGIMRKEMVIVYPHAWVAIVQRDMSFEVARMD